MEIVMVVEVMEVTELHGYVDGRRGRDVPFLES